MQNYCDDQSKFNQLRGLCLQPLLPACHWPGCLLHFGQQWCRENQSQFWGQPSPRHVFTLILQWEDRWKYELRVGDISKSTHWGKDFWGKVIFSICSLPHEASETSSEDFQKHLEVCAYELKRGLPASYKAVVLAANPKHKAQLISETWWRFSDTQTSSCEHNLWLHSHFMLVRQCRDPWGESKCTVLLNLTNSQFVVLKPLDFKAKSRWMFLRRKAYPFSVWTIKLYLKEWGKGLKSLV